PQGTHGGPAMRTPALAVVPFLAVLLGAGACLAQCPGEWSRIAAPGGLGTTNGGVLSVAAGAGGVIYAGSAFSGNTTLERWNGSAWSSLGLMGTSVNALAIAPGGDLYA